MQDAEVVAGGQPRAQPLRQRLVELDRDQGAAARGESAGEHAATGPDFQDRQAVVGDGVEDGVAHGGVAQEVLAQGRAPAARGGGSARHRDSFAVFAGSGPRAATRDRGPVPGGPGAAARADAARASRGPHAPPPRLGDGPGGAPKRQGAG